MRPGKDLHKRYSGGKALITGASDGIGKQYAYILAEQGFDIVLMGRNFEKTQAVAEDVKAKHGVDTQVIIFDFDCAFDEENNQ